MSEPGARRQLVFLTAEALHQRAAYILEHANDIAVRVRRDGRYESLWLTELPASDAIREAFRLLLRTESLDRMRAEQTEEIWPEEAG